MSGHGNFDVWINLTIDHVVPSAEGGDDSEENKVVACGECNTLKSKYVPVGDSFGKTIADARRRVHERREASRKLFAEMTKDVAGSAREWFEPAMKSDAQQSWGSPVALS